MLKQLKNWTRRNAYGKFAWQLLLGLGSAAITVALGWLPYESVFQAAWVVAATTYLGIYHLSRRLNETDDVRYRRLYQSRFSHLQKTDPDALNTIFAENIRPPVLAWFEQEHGLSLAEVKQIDALDSLARSGDLPGQLIFRTGVQLGRWLEAGEGHDDPLEFLRNRLDEFIDDNEQLLGEEIADGVFVRHVEVGEHRPVGIHLFHPRSICLLSVETGYSGRRALSLSIKGSVVKNLTTEQWQAFKEEVLRQLPLFRPSQGGSGPQKQTIPLFVSPWLDVAGIDVAVVRQQVIALMARFQVADAPAELTEVDVAAASETE